MDRTRYVLIPSVICWPFGLAYDLYLCPLDASPEGLHLTDDYNDRLSEARRDMICYIVLSAGLH
jgi:hypothetical protein